ncbi:bifunctional folylpolyglutamate synthase/dihydrofolate synthase [Nitrospirota bacterium]
MQYDETIDYLFALQWHGIKLGLDNPRELLRRLGNPEKGIPYVHIAGTNGKGSTAAMLSAMLTASGRRTGLFTSPHLVSFTERISVDRQQITEDEVVSLASEVMAASEGMKPTFFEAVTAMGFLHFRHKAVDLAVIETGMGGRLDATNVIEPGVVIITPIGLDHAEFLGASIEEVAAEKAGIIKPGARVICAAQEPAAMAVIEKQAQKCGASVHLEGREFGPENIVRDSGGVEFDYACGKGTMKKLRLALRGEYQARNASLAMRALELMVKEPDWDNIRKALAGARWPGRLELAANNPTTYVDGAHNPAAAEALSAELRAEGLEGGMALVLGVMSDKDAEGIIRPLLPLGREVFLTRAAYGRAASTETLAKTVRALGFSGGVTEIIKVSEAISVARSLGLPVLVAGSFYTAGEALEALGAKGVLRKLGEAVPDSTETPAGYGHEAN